MNAFKVSIIAIGAALTLAGCASLPPGMTGQFPSSPLHFTQPEAQTIQHVEIGTVIAVRDVPIQTDSARAAIGSGIGALAGGLIGHQVGGGKGKTLATVAGAVAGAIGGNMVAARAYKQPGLAITVRISQQWGGQRTVQITQAVAAGVSIHPGDRVEIIGTGCYGGNYCPSPARVIPLPASAKAMPALSPTRHDIDAALTEYEMNTQVSEGLMFAGRAAMAVDTYFELHGAFPASVAQAESVETRNTPKFEEFGRYVGSVAIGPAQGSITVTWTRGVLTGKRLVLDPWRDNWQRFCIDASTTVSAAALTHAVGGHPVPCWRGPAPAGGSQ